jgi:lipopolysaccharide export system protein LptA
MRVISRIILLLVSLFPAGLFSQEVTKILLEKADSWEYNQAIGKDVQRIIGNVIFSHDSTMMYCDSAYLNEEQNNVIAFGNVHIRVSDTLNLFGDSLRYDGNTKTAHIRSNVKLIDNETTLTTDTLVYNRTTRIAQYDYWGKIVNGKNDLVSKHGYYHTDVKQFFFKEKVILINPEHVMHADTLMYNTMNETAYFFGPTNIISKDRIDSMYTENGWYNTKTDISRFLKKGVIYHENQILRGDTLYYEQGPGFGRANGNAEIIDTVKDVIIRGNYGEVRRNKGFAFMTDHALAIMIEKKKDSLFMHSDSIIATFNDRKEEIRDLFGYYKAKFFRRDMQGMCDSIVYHGADSAMMMYKSPVIWSGVNQLTADSIRFTIRNQEADSMVLYNSAFIAQMDDTNKFNQVRGRDMIGYFHHNDLYKVRVIGNAETVYWMREDDRSLIGIKKVAASSILIFLKNNQLKSLTYMDKPAGAIYPEKDISPFDLKLKGFTWVANKRPAKKEDIFTW